MHVISLVTIYSLATEPPLHVTFSTITCSAFTFTDGMARLTQDELSVIEQSPFNDSLDEVRRALRDAASESSEVYLDTDADTPGRPRLFAAAVAKLIYILSGSDVSLALGSRAGRDALISDLAAIRVRIRKGVIDYRIFRPLSQLVVKTATDAEIWQSVIALIRADSQATPSPSRPSSFDTPITHSSASQQGSEQTRQKIEPRVFEEIRHCTHRAVGGFHEKYFGDRKWSRRARRVWKEAKVHYNDNEKRWKGFPMEATEDEVCGWLLNLQQGLLASERATFCRTSTNSRVGTEAPRQLDLLVKAKSSNRTDTRHEWEDVLVVGELKKSDNKAKGLWLQIGSAIRNVFASQPRRRFVHAFTLTGTKMENWVFDRSGPYSGTVFDIHEQPEKFMQVFCGYLMMTDDELGLDTFCKQTDSELFVTLPQGLRGRKRKFELDATPISHQRAIVCRGTSCYLAKPSGSKEFCGVVKFSWTSSLRPPEADLLTKAHERGVKGLAKLVGYHEEVTSIEKLRAGLVFSTPHKFRGGPRSATSSFSHSQALPSRSFSQFPGVSIASSGSKRKSVDENAPASKRSRSSSRLAGVETGGNSISYQVQKPEGTSLIQLEQTPFDNRILRALAISPPGRSVTQFTSISELLQCLRDAIKVHRSLLIDGKILHRDISENNIIITDPKIAEGFNGMLIDLDLAKEEGQGPSGARHRTGTMEFMAIEVLLGIAHTYRHDLEAFFYVLIWLCARRGWNLASKSGRAPKSSMLSRWYTGGYQDIAQSKRGDMDKNGLEVILREFPAMFNCLKPLCRAIRDALFPHKDGLFTGSPQDPHILYGPIIEAFDGALAEIDSE